MPNIKIGHFTLTTEAAEKMGFVEQLKQAEQAQSRKQMEQKPFTPGQTTTQGKRLPELMAEGAREAFIDPIQKMTSPSSTPEQKAEAGLSFGGLGVIGKATPDLFQGMHQVVAKKVERMQEFLKQNPDRWQDTFVHDPTTGRNYFQDMRGELLVEYPDVTEAGKLGEGWLVHTASLAHPDPKAKELLTEVAATVSPLEKGTYYQSRETYSGTRREIGVQEKGKETIYPHLTKSFEKIHGETKELHEKWMATTLGTPESYAARDAYFAASDKKAQLVLKATGLQGKKEKLHQAFNTSYLAHEATHALQDITGLPRGGSPAKEATRIFKETIGSNPQKLVEYEHSLQLAENWLSQDPVQTMVALTQMKPRKDVYQKYIDMLYASSDEERAASKFYKKIEEKDKFGKVTGVSYKPDVNKILNEFARDAAAGKINLEGTALEPWHKMNVGAFEQYKRLHGEVYARIAQSRAFKAASGKDPDIYKKNPQAEFDVPVEEILYPEESKMLETLLKKVK